MLDNYKDKQDLIYNLMIRAINNDKISHAYLIESNKNITVDDFVLAIVKTIVCPNHYTNFTLCNDCHLCDRIDDGNFTELKIIEPDGLWIKKEQLLDLQDEFTKKGVENEKRIYIIKNCDRMNGQAANSLLKFLEEPVDNIYAFLITDNINRVLKTIVSRCQILTMKSEKENFDKTIQSLANLIGNSKMMHDQIINDDKYQKMIDGATQFISYLEKYKYDTIIYNKKMWHDIFKDKESNIIGIDLLINFYYDVLRMKIGIDRIFYKEYLDIFDFVNKNNEMDKILKKINILLEVKENIKFNLNPTLMVDKLVIDLGGV